MGESVLFRIMPLASISVIISHSRVYGQHKLKELGYNKNKVNTKLGRGKRVS